MACEEFAPVIEKRTPFAVPQCGREPQLVGQPPVSLAVVVTVGQNVRPVELLVEVGRMDWREMKASIFAEGIMQFRRRKNALRRRPSIHPQYCQRPVAMVRPLAEK